MEMQRHAQLMYTSCGWFFDDISGIETVQIIAYAARVLQLARRSSASRPQRWSLRFSRGWLRPTPTNLRRATARRFTRNASRRWSCDLEQVAAHYAISSVFSSFADETDLFAFTFAASPTTFTPPAADGWRWAASCSQCRHRPRTELSRSRFSTSATRTLLPPSRPMRSRCVCF